MFDERDSPLDEQQVQTDLRRLSAEGRTLRALGPDDVDLKAIDPRVVARLVPRNPVVKDETVVEFLRELLGRLERGEIDVSEGFIIHYLSSCGPKSTDPVKHGYWRYGLSQLRHLGLLTVGVDAVMKEDV